MEASLSPMKRRAVLGAKDANAALATPNTTTNKITRIATPMLSTPSSAFLVTSPLREGSPEEGEEERKRKKKRTAEERGREKSPEAKKTCMDGTAPSRSPSVETSSLFDASAGDASWTTTTAAPPTEPDTPLVAATRPRALTREQAREKAEILRLRLGLAGYKLRTGQTTIPLSQLQRKPVLFPAAARRRRASTMALAKPTNAHSRARSADSVPAPASQESTASEAASDAALTWPASQESAVVVVVETRGNSPDGAGSQER